MRLLRARRSVVPAVPHLTAPFAAQLAAMRHCLDVHGSQPEFGELDEIALKLDAFATAATVYASASGFWLTECLVSVVVSAKLSVH